MAIVSEEYYNDTFQGLPVATADFPQLEAWAERAIASITRGRVSEGNLSSLPLWVQTAYQDAICAQVSYYAEEGLATALRGDSDTSFTVGKVSVSSGGSGSGSSGRGSMICLLAYSLLEQTGLLNPQRPAFDGWCCW